MAREIKTEIIIDGTADKVWNELMNFNSFPDWNPFIKELKVNNELKVGQKLTVLLHLQNKKPQTFKPTIKSLIPNKEFSWLGNLFMPKIFDGYHYFQLEEQDNKTKFIQKERFSGIFGFIIKFIAKDTLASFKSMNEILKQRVESQGAY